MAIVSGAFQANNLGTNQTDARPRGNPDLRRLPCGPDEHLLARPPHSPTYPQKTIRTYFMRDDYILAAKTIIPDPYILVNVVSRRVKQLRAGSRPLVESLEKLRNEDIALREIAEGKISFELG